MFNGLAFSVRKKEILLLRHQAKKLRALCYMK